jgi:hypothetical protein
MVLLGQMYAAASRKSAVCLFVCECVYPCVGIVKGGSTEQCLHCGVCKMNGALDMCLCACVLVYVCMELRTHGRSILV